MIRRFTESVVEDAALAWFEGLGYPVKHGREIAPGELAAEQKAVVAENATAQFQSKYAKIANCCFERDHRAGARSSHGNRFQIGKTLTWAVDVFDSRRRVSNHRGLLSC